MLAAGGFRDSLDLPKRAHDVRGHEAPNLMDTDMLIILRVEQVAGEISRTAPLVAMEDHDQPPQPKPAMS